MRNESGTWLHVLYVILTIDGHHYVESVVIVGWRSDDLVPFDTTDEPVDAFLDAVPSQARGRENHAVSFANRLGVVVKDGLHFSDTHAL